MEIPSVASPKDIVTLNKTKGETTNHQLRYRADFDRFASTHAADLNKGKLQRDPTLQRDSVSFSPSTRKKKRDTEQSFERFMKASRAAHVLDEWETHLDTVSTFIRRHVESDDEFIPIYRTIDHNVPIFTKELRAGKKGDFKDDLPLLHHEGKEALNVIANATGKVLRKAEHSERYLQADLLGQFKDFAEELGKCASGAVAKLQMLAYDIQNTGAGVRAIIAGERSKWICAHIETFARKEHGKLIGEGGLEEGEHVHYALGYQIHFAKQYGLIVHTDDRVNPVVHEAERLKRCADYLQAHCNSDRFVEHIAEKYRDEINQHYPTKLIPADDVSPRVKTGEKQLTKRKPVFTKYGIIPNGEYLEEVYDDQGNLHYQVAKDIVPLRRSLAKNFEKEHVFEQFRARQLARAKEAGWSVSQIGDMLIGKTYSQAKNPENRKTLERHEVTAEDLQDSRLSESDSPALILPSLHFKQHELARRVLANSLTNEGATLSLQRLIGGDRDLSVHTSIPRNAIMEFAKVGDRKSIDTLLKQNAIDPNVQDAQGYTLLMHAVENGKEDVVKRLVTANVSLHLTNNQGRTALHLAASNGYPRIINGLLIRDADIEARDAEKNTPLLLAVKNNKPSAVTALLQHGANLEAADVDGNTAFLQAAFDGHIPMLQEIGRTAKGDEGIIRAENRFGRNALMLAALGGHKEIFETFENRFSFDPNVRDKPKNTALMLGAKSGEIDLFKHILSGKADPLATNLDGMNAFMLAAENGHTEVMQHALQFSPKIDRRNTKSETALMLAARNGDIETVRELLAKKAAVDVKNHLSATALLLAAEQGHSDVVSACIKANANLNQQDSQGYTALARACHGSHLETIEVLIRAGADIRIGNKNRKTPLMDAARTNSVAVLKMLLSATAKLEDSDDENWTALTFAAANGSNESAKLLLEAGSQIDAKDDDGYTPLMRAADKNHARMINFLAGRGADKERRDNSDATALILAADSGSADALEALLQLGANIGAKNRYKQTALHRAVDRNMIRSVTTLLKHSVELEAADDDGKTPLNLAAENGHDKIVNILLQRGATVDASDSQGITPLMQTAKRGYLNSARALIDRGADANLLAKDKRTALICAAQNGHIELVSLLLDNGAKKTIDARNTAGQTALMLAAKRGKSKSLEILLSSGAKTDITDKENMTATMHAASSSSVKALKILLNACNNINEKDASGKTALFYAIRSEKCEEMIDALVAKSADIEAEDKNGNTAGMQAAKEYSVKAMERLIYHGANFNRKSSDNETVLMQYVKRSINFNYPIADLLAGLVDDIDAVDSKGKSALIHAAESGNTSAMQLLLDKSANAQLLDKNGMNALMYACKSSSYHHSIDAILAQTQDVDVADTVRKKTALIYACESNNYPAVVSLLTRNPNIDHQDASGMTAFMRALRHSDSFGGWNQIGDALIQRNPNLLHSDSRGKSTLMYAAEQSSLSLFQQVRQANPKGLRKKDRDGMDALMYASRAGMSGNFDDLLNEGTSILLNNEFDRFDQMPDVHARNNRGESVSMFAAQSGNTYIIERLQQLGAQLDLADANGNNPMFRAAYYDRSDAIKKLAQYSLSVNSRNAWNFTPLMVASHRGNSLAVSTLLALGADRSTMSNNGFTAETLASQNIVGDEKATKQKRRRLSDASDAGKEILRKLAGNDRRLLQ